VLAKDLGTKGITVNAVAPGPVDTDFFRGDGKSDQTIQLIANLHPSKHIPLAHEIAPLVAFLGRDEAGWVNGQTIMVNGVSVKTCFECFTLTPRPTGDGRVENSYLIFVRD
jgi:3-oxoacyl-[acyl-carrier protein] reductase